MNEGITKYTTRFFSKSKDDGEGIKGDYRAKLLRTTQNRASGGDVAQLASCPYADRIRNVVTDTRSGVAFQSLAVASLQTLRSVLASERQAAEAAISLAQSEKLEHMMETVEATAEAVSDVLDAQGSHMLNLTVDEEAASDDENSWWFTLTESIQAIEDGTNRILSLAAGQPKGGAGRRLSAVVVSLLRKQHQQLLAEADAWIS